ncbi:MAG TPA: ERCC4 domain-containing protein [Candidatus Nanoarchaeia archaeon]|nr:ERCC4 domain-containing protein [Candidatus Nanoarchaeia archaeon]
MTKIIVDHRENKQMIKELAKVGLDIDVKQLAIADFVLEVKTEAGELQTIGIERKTTQDFLDSIIDKRLVNQLILLKQNFNFPLLILEGTEDVYTLRNFHPNSIRGMIASICLDMQVPMITTRSFRDTAKMIKVISSKFEKSRKPISLLTKRKPLTTKEMQEYIIESLPGVGPTIAKNLLNKFKNVKNIFNASEEELIEVDKIGKIKAKEIKKIIDEHYF